MAIEDTGKTDENLEQKSEKEAHEEGSKSNTRNMWPGDFKFWLYFMTVNSYSVMILTQSLQVCYSSYSLLVLLL